MFFIETGENGQGIKMDVYKERFTLVTGRKLQDGRVWVDFCHGQVNKPERIGPERQHMIAALPPSQSGRVRHVWATARPHGIDFGVGLESAISTAQKVLEELIAMRGQVQHQPQRTGAVPSESPFG